MKKIFLLLLCLPILSCGKNRLVLVPDQVAIVVAESEVAPVQRAVQTLVSDFEKVTGNRPRVLSKIPQGDAPVIVVVNRESRALDLPWDEMKPLDGFESHRVWVSGNRIYVDGFDMRGAIYAIYTFSEQFLGVPPLWFWATWEPEKRKKVVVPATTDLMFRSPQVRYRAWLPNDTDLYAPWIRKSHENADIMYETMLRLKLNTVEAADLAYPGIGMGMRQCKKFGLVVTSHHMYMLNTTFSSWRRYWESVRKVKEVPQLSLANIDKVYELWEYGAKTVVESGVENIWNIAFRGSGDQPFWVLFPDAPQDEQARAQVINKMLREQVRIIKKYAQEEHPYIRITFYDEVADLVNSGLVTPPQDENMIWTFCSGRRDHYPYDDVQQFSPETPVKLGYYMNLQFTSTGSHLAPGEGPWKMEFNYRYVNGKSPLYLSVVNSGNFREFLYTMTANAKLLWDYEAFDCDAWNLAYARQYFGGKYAPEIAQLYKDYFSAYWEQRKPDFPGGMPRQFIFHDMRHARAVGYISRDFFHYNENPLPDYFGYERVKGRVFRVVPEDNGVTNQVDALLVGMEKSSAAFAQVTQRAGQLLEKLDADKKQFFYDNLYAYAAFMSHLSRMLYHYTYAYKHQDNKPVLVENLEEAYAQMESARDILLSTQHHAFETWYATDSKFNMQEVLTQIKQTLDAVK